MFVCFVIYVLALSLDNLINIYLKKKSSPQKVILLLLVILCESGLVDEVVLSD